MLTKEYKEKYYQDNREQILNKCKEYYLKNKEKIDKRTKQYHQANKEHLEKKAAEWRNKNKEKINEKSNLWYTNNKVRRTIYQESIFERSLYTAAKTRSRGKEMVFSILKEDVVIPEKCVYLNCILTRSQGIGRVQTNASLDRVDSTKGYTKDNIQVISDLANKMKQDATIEQLITFAKGVLKLHAGIDIDKILIDNTKV